MRVPIRQIVVVLTSVCLIGTLSLFLLGASEADSAGCGGVVDDIAPEPTPTPAGGSGGGGGPQVQLAPCGACTYYNDGSFGYEPGDRCYCEAAANCTSTCDLADSKRDCRWSDGGACPGYAACTGDRDLFNGCAVPSER